MAYKYYNRYLSIRIVFLVLLAAFIGWSVATHQSVALIVFLSSVEILLIGELMRFTNRSNRQISFFIQAIKNDDTTLRFPKQTGNAIINDLHKSLNELNVILQETKLKSKIKESYFSEILQNIGTGIMVYNSKGFVTDVNPAALNMFGIQTLTHLSQLDSVDAQFKLELTNLTDLQKQVITLHRPTETIQVVVRCSTISSRNEDVRLVTMQDIRGELERKEIDSWVKLIRVMSHEIMNSLAPVTSIAQSLHDIWKSRASNDEKISQDEDVLATINGLEVIDERGNGLIRFVQSYRKLTREPIPQLSEVDMQNFFDSLSILVSPMKSDFGVVINFRLECQNFVTRIDEQMIAQVIINLVKNAAESMAGIDNPKIEVVANILPSGIREIKVINNGPDIPPEILDEIFVPFFTTKSTGSGIGLSYSRQIMRAHGGSITCSSNNRKTEFKVQW